jgi:hypothetical protein
LKREGHQCWIMLISKPWQKGMRSQVAWLEQGIPGSSTRASCCRAHVLYPALMWDPSKSWQRWRRGQTRSTLRFQRSIYYLYYIYIYIIYAFNLLMNTWIPTFSIILFKVVAQATTRLSQQEHPQRYGEVLICHDHNTPVAKWFHRVINFLLLQTWISIGQHCSCKRADQCGIGHPSYEKVEEFRKPEEGYLLFLATRSAMGQLIGSARSNMHDDMMYEIVCALFFAQWGQRRSFHKHMLPAGTTCSGFAQLLAPCRRSIGSIGSIRSIRSFAQWTLVTFAGSGGPCGPFEWWDFAEVKAKDLNDILDFSIANCGLKGGLKGRSKCQVWK